MHKKQRLIREDKHSSPQISTIDYKVQVERIIREMMDDPEVAYRSTAVLYQDFLIRCRIHGVSEFLPNISQFRRKLAIAQASIDEEDAAKEEWKRVLLLSKSLENDIQGVFLRVAQAAVTGKPCPSDAVLARLYGTHSLSRARRLLIYFEERGLIVIHTDFSGKRVVTFPGLNLETAPGDPKAPI